MPEYNPVKIKNPRSIFANGFYSSTNGGESMRIAPSWNVGDGRQARYGSALELIEFVDSESDLPFTRMRSSGGVDHLKR